jgi:hypothetical protein
MSHLIRFDDWEIQLGFDCRSFETPSENQYFIICEGSGIKDLTVLPKFTKFHHKAQVARD